MPRARIIKPSFFSSEVIADLAPLTRLLFVGLWQLADRDGKLEDRPRRIANALLAFDHVDGDAALDELAAAGLVVRYMADGAALLYLPTFAKHQHPHAREVASVLPYPSEVVPEHDLGEPLHRLGALDPDDLDPKITSTARAREADPVRVALSRLYEAVSGLTIGPRTDDEIVLWSEKLTVEDVAKIKEEADGRDWPYVRAICGRAYADRKRGSDPWRDRDGDGSQRSQPRGAGRRRMGSAGGARTRYDIKYDDDGNALDPSTGRRIAKL